MNSYPFPFFAAFSVAALRPSSTSARSSNHRAPIFSKLSPARRARTRRRLAAFNDEDIAASIVERVEFHQRCGYDQ